MTENIFLQMAALLGITVTTAFFIRLLKQPLVVAYILAGILAGPVFLNVINGSEAFFNAFAQFGIVLLLFVVGLSFNLTHLKSVGKDIFVGGTLQFFFTSLLGMVIMRWLGFGWISAAFVAVAITFSSTIIIVKLLGDKKDLETVYGRYIVGILVIQDLIAISILIFLTTFARAEFSISQSILLTVIKAGFLGIGVYLVAHHLLPIIMPRVAKSNELLFIFTIAWCFGVASLVLSAGFSIEIGAIIAGMTLGASPFQSEIMSRIKPLRDFFIVLFFIVLGSGLEFNGALSAMKPGILISLFVLVVEPIILYIVMRALKYTRRNAFLVALSAAQVSEFAFILAFKGRELGYIGHVEFAILTIVALITITISSYLMEYNEWLYKKFLPFFHRFGKDKMQERQIGANEKKQYEAYVFGYHRIGWKICEALAARKVEYVVVDFNPQAIEKLQRRGIPCYFGDASDLEFLQELPLDKAKMIISTIPHAEDQLTLINHIRSRSTKTFIIANLSHRDYLTDLYKAGANFVLMPHLLGGHWMSEIIQKKSWTKRTFATLQKEQQQEMEQRFTADTIG